MWGEAHWGQLGLPKEFRDLHQSLPAKCPVLQDGSEEKIVKISCGTILIERDSLVCIVFLRTNSTLLAYEQVERILLH